MTDAAEVRVWLVERDYTDKGMVTLVYATTAGDRVWRRQLSPVAAGGDGARAARTVTAGDLSSAPEGERERYAAEARRVAERNDPDDRL